MFMAADAGAAVSEDARYPKLKGQAGEIKRLTKALLAVFQEHMPSAVDDAERIVHKQIALMLKKCAQADDILDNHSPHLHPRLPVGAAADFRQVQNIVVYVFKGSLVFRRP